jgi:hypothetical protein
VASLNHFPHSRRMADTSPQRTFGHGLGTLVALASNGLDVRSLTPMSMRCSIPSTSQTFNAGVT